jgi:hypothetical protein
MSGSDVSCRQERTDNLPLASGTSTGKRGKMQERSLRISRWIGISFIWLGIAVGLVSFLMRVPDLQTVSGLLFALTDAIRITGESVGFGLLLIMLSEIVRLLQVRRNLSSEGD